MHSYAITSVRIVAGHAVATTYRISTRDISQPASDTTTTHAIGAIAMCGSDGGRAAENRGRTPFRADAHAESAALLAVVSPFDPIARRV